MAVGATPEPRRSTARLEEQRRRRRIGLAVAAVFAALALATIVIEWSAITDSVRNADVGGVLDDIGAGWQRAVLNPWYWGLIIVLIVLERLWPAQRDGGMLTKGGAQDVLWILVAPILTLTVVAVYLTLLDRIYHDVLGGVTVDLDAAIGTVATAVIAFVIADFFMWFTHLLRHKVPTFWYFHAVHHAAPTLNALTDNRVHFVEAIIAATIVFVPATFLGVDAAAASILAIATVYFTAFTHANVRTNLGPLRYLLVTPQSHRVHHSDASEHIDTNFATTFSVWDRVFKTQYLGEDEYPPTGIEDPDFPLEQRGTPGHLCATYARQVVYPFRQVARDLGKLRAER